MPHFPTLQNEFAIAAFVVQSASSLVLLGMCAEAQCPSWRLMIGATRFSDIVHLVDKLVLVLDDDDDDDDVDDGIVD